MRRIIAQHRKPRSRHEEVEAMLRAFTEHDLQAIQALADAGCDLDAASGGLTVLMRAVLRRDAEAVEWMLAAGADPRVAGSDGRTALDLARDLGAAEIAELLILAGAGSGEETEDAAIDPPAPAAGPLRSAPPRRAFRDRFEDRFDDRFDDRFEDAFKRPAASSTSSSPGRPSPGSAG